MGLPTVALFSESNGRLLVEVTPAHAPLLEAHFGDIPLTRLGTVTATAQVVVTHGGDTLVDLPVDKLVAAWQRK